jgi:hypothetical protein
MVLGCENKKKEIDLIFFFSTFVVQIFKAKTTETTTTNTT